MSKPRDYSGLVVLGFWLTVALVVGAVVYYEVVKFRAYQAISEGRCK